MPQNLLPIGTPVSLLFPTIPALFAGVASKPDANGHPTFVLLARPEEPDPADTTFGLGTVVPVTIGGPNVRPLYAAIDLGSIDLAAIYWSPAYTRGDLPPVIDPTIILGGGA